MEPTFGWITHFRSLVHAFERCIGVSKAMIYVAWDAFWSVDCIGGSYRFILNRKILRAQIIVIAIIFSQ